MVTRQRSFRVDETAWESYRLHQRDVLLQCFEDADLMLRRMHVPLNDADRIRVVEMLFDKRCQPWKYYRDEQRAVVR
jgi:hypothetical protein